MEAATIIEISNFSIILLAYCGVVFYRRVAPYERDKLVTLIGLAIGVVILFSIVLLFFSHDIMAVPYSHHKTS